MLIQKLLFFNPKDQTMEKKSRTPQEIINEIITKSSPKGRCIYRGVNGYKEDDISSENAEKRVNSSLYRNPRYKKNWGDNLKLLNKEKNLVEDARGQLFDQNTDNINILTDLRHFGAEVNLIDFSRNLNIALFFACNGEDARAGEVIILPIENMEKKTQINYDGGNKLTDVIIEPAKTESSKIRVMAQDSVFVYPLEGYLSKEKWDWDDVEIKPNEKKGMLDYLEKFHNISKKTIFNDLIGFIQNEKNNQKEEKDMHYNQILEKNSNNGFVYHARANFRVNSLNFLEAIEDYTKAISLKNAYHVNFLSISPSNEIELYRSRGNCNYALKKFDKSIEDYNEAEYIMKRFTISNPNYQNPDLYYGRGSAKERLGHFDDALKDFEKSRLQGNKDASYAKGFALVQQGKLQEAKDVFLEAKKNFPDKKNIEETISFLEDVINKIKNDEFQVQIDDLKADFRVVRFIKKSLLKNNKLTSSPGPDFQILIQGYKGIRGNTGVFFYEENKGGEGTNGFPGIMGFHFKVIL